VHNFENGLGQAHTEKGEGDFVMPMNLSKFEASACDLRRVLIERCVKVVPPQNERIVMKLTDISV